MTGKQHMAREKAEVVSATVGEQLPQVDARLPLHLTVQERMKLGKEAREQCARADQAAWDPPKNRPDPVGLLEAQAAARIPELIPIRYGRMLASPFAFYRGAAAIMASDLAVTPNSGLHVQLCGDAHVSNFGGFDADDGRQSVAKGMSNAWRRVSRLWGASEALGRNCAERSSWRL